MQVFSWVFQSITRVVSVRCVPVRCGSLRNNNFDYLNGSDSQAPPLALAGSALHFFLVKMIEFKFPNLHHLIGIPYYPMECHHYLVGPPYSQTECHFPLFSGV